MSGRKKRARTEGEDDAGDQRSSIERLADLTRRILKVPKAEIEEDSRKPEQTGVDPKRRVG